MTANTGRSSASRDRVSRLVTTFTAGAAIGSGAATLFVAGSLAAAAPPPAAEPAPGPPAGGITQPDRPQLSPPPLAPTAGSGGEPVTTTSAS